MLILTVHLPPPHASPSLCLLRRSPLATRGAPVITACSPPSELPCTPPHAPPPLPRPPLRPAHLGQAGSHRLHHHCRCSMSKRVRPATPGHHLCCTDLCPSFSHSCTTAAHPLARRSITAVILCHRRHCWCYQSPERTWPGRPWAILGLDASPMARLWSYGPVAPLPHLQQLSSRPESGRQRPSYARCNEEEEKDLTLK